MAYRLVVNGRFLMADVEAGTPLLWVLRDSLNLTGTKYGCGVGACGACTVQLDGAPVHSCLTPIETVGERQVTTIEGLSPDGSHPLQRAWVLEDVPQCGFCQPGMILKAEALLRQTPHPGVSEINAAMTNLCRCGTYDGIRRAILRAARA